MKKMLIAAVLGLVPALASAEHYGAPITAGNAVPLEQAVSQLEGKTTADVLVRSKVDKVCVKKGCWLGLRGDSGELHVTFKDYAFFVPGSLIGKTVLVQGKLEKVAMTLEETRHYVQDAGGDPSKVTEPRVHYQLTASGVEVAS